MLKALFPADIVADKASYEIQYGMIERPAHYNTSWDGAKFEVAAQKWVDLSDAGQGVSVLNDCKYGHDIHNGVIRITLLRSTMAPCPDSDRGRHSFTYSLYPHRFGWREALTAREAYDLNVPLSSVFAAGALAGKESQSLADCDCESVNIEVLKAADDGNGVIIRAYEAHGGRARVELSVAGSVTEAYECDMLERVIEKAEYWDGILYFDIKPYEIKTFRLI